ncbi:glycerate kinase type-2 family protein [Sphingosinicella rhizophila]|uniref:DUF4147 domain-containing protein n=1 Tax=Sphingosinicella rhizophila TaxID=3050082 RepID=A0ABU3Q6J9_9SPHN|nr:DUF4147 domain-containing protein [Sphingosinicella sp. GR2756]MDT9599032.1 DUF4147 domain-containing protein [Sphingosinicella sp. GR2756]
MADSFVVADLFTRQRIDEVPGLMKRSGGLIALAMDVRAKLEAIFRMGMESCRPARLMPPHLPDPPAGKTFLLALGKAAVPMAETVERNWEGPLSGLAVAPHGNTGRLERIEVLEAAHPVPDESSLAAAQRLLDLASAAGRGDLVLVLLSGGASSLASLPGQGLGLAEKQRIVRDLLRSGAPIGEINIVRRHLSAFKGGRLALAAAPARLVTIAISDVEGDRMEDIGSGPTVADPTTIGEARALLAKYDIVSPAAGWSESAKTVTGDWRLAASAGRALAAAAEKAAALGYRPIVSEIYAEAREAGRAQAELALRSPPGTALISGGELTVTVVGKGHGGPNQEFALAAAMALAGHPNICGLAADTDGVDGRSEAAGAFFDGDTIGRFRGDSVAMLARNDSGSLFAATGDLFVTGPTGTNVNDLRVLLIDS